MASFLIFEKNAHRRSSGNSEVHLNASTLGLACIHDTAWHRPRPRGRTDRLADLG